MSGSFAVGTEFVIGILQQSSEDLLILLGRDLFLLDRRSSGGSRAIRHAIESQITFESRYLGLKMKEKRFFGVGIWGQQTDKTIVCWHNADIDVKTNFSPISIFHRNSTTRWVQTKLKFYQILRWQRIRNRNMCTRFTRKLRRISLRLDIRWVLAFELKYDLTNISHGQL